MNPKLVALHGPLKGGVVEFLDEQISIGRDRTNSVRVRDKLVSRCHAVIRQNSGRIEIMDLNSINGTFVNGVPVRERILEGGDQIRIGHSVFAVVTEEEDLARFPTEDQLDQSKLVTRSQIRLRQEDSSYLNRTRSLPELTERATNDLQALLAICTEINAIRKPEILQRRLLESIFDVIPADVGAVL